MIAVEAQSPSWEQQCVFKAPAGNRHQQSHQRSDGFKKQAVWQEDLVARKDTIGEIEAIDVAEGQRKLIPDIESEIRSLIQSVLIENKEDDAKKIDEDVKTEEDYYDLPAYVRIDKENNVILVKGSVPGPRKSLVSLKTTVKA